MNNIQLVWFQTTKGHFGDKQIYRYTLNNLRRNIDLNYFNKKILSLKVFNDDQYEDIVNNFSGFQPFIWHKNDIRIDDKSSYKDYAYYLLTNYLYDICNFYSTIKKNEYSEYTYLVEDDSPEICISGSLSDFLEDSIKTLSNNSDIFSINLRRVGLPSENGYLESELTFVKDKNISDQSHLYNFQNQVFRTKEMIVVVENILKNINDYINLHTEMAMEKSIRECFPNVLNLTYNPSIINSIHIGAENNKQFIKEYNL